MTLSKPLNVELGERSYPIFIGNNLLKNQGFMADYITGHSAIIITNTKVAPLYLKQIETSLANWGIRFDSVLLQDGEAYKTMSAVEGIIDKLIEARHDRKTTVIALGGGVVGDIAGFSAAIYQRGVNFIQIPTTLLSQVDSSVGGKTGVNHPQGKNMIGAFYQPQCVIADTSTLDTLPDRELSAGMAEVIKYGLIYDIDFFAWLELNIDALMSRDKLLLSQAIRESCQIKATIVAMDERESGIRAILNLGHTFGHAIEAVMGYGNWLHGEAVAAGMIMAIDLSQRHGWIKPDFKQRVQALLIKAGLPVKAPAEISVTQFLDAMSIDKKVDKGIIKLILLTKPGEAIVTSDYDPSLLKQTLLKSH